MASAIEIGQTDAGKMVSIPLAMATRHGLITGATGTGKTRTMQLMLEEFSRAGVPTFAADVKGDVSGIAALGDAASGFRERAAKLGAEWAPTAFPAAFWDIFAVHGLPIRTSIQAMGAGLLSRMLGLNPTQEGAMEIVFRKAEDDQAWMLTLEDLRWSLNDMLEEREEVSKRYGNVTASSIAAIQRNLLALESQGGDRLFGEAPFDIADFMRVDADGRGVVNLLHADKLMEAPKLYATFLLWLLSELFRRLPEAGDLEKPKLVFFFDEAHLLFKDAPKNLVQQIERLVRLVRSKGVGVYFVTQSPLDVPANVLEQLGTRVLHAMRAHTAASLKTIRAAADTIRPNKAIKTREVLPVLGMGEALISVIGDDNVPTMVERVRILPPTGQIGPISDLERSAIIEGSDLGRKYRATVPAAEASYAFIRRMKEQRGIDPGLDTGPAPYEPGLYLKYLPEVVEEREGPGTVRRLAGIAFWAVVALSGAKLAGWV